MSRNNRRQADPRRATPYKMAVSCYLFLLNTPRQTNGGFMSLLLPRTPNGTPTSKPTQEIHDEIKTRIRIKADHIFGDLYRARKENGILENEADLVAGASAMLQLLNEITFNPEEGEEMSLVPPSWLFLLFSGRGLGELYDDTTKQDEILEAVSREEVNQ